MQSSSNLWQSNGSVEISSKYDAKKGEMRIAASDCRQSRSSISVTIVMPDQPTREMKFSGTSSLIASLGSILNDTGIEFNNQELMAELARIFLSYNP